jgi:hypothetical protein
LVNADCPTNLVASIFPLGETYYLRHLIK